MRMDVRVVSVLGADAVFLDAPHERLAIRVLAAPVLLNDGQRELARRALRELRFGLESGYSERVELAERLVGAVDGVGPVAPRSFHASLADRAFSAHILERLEQELFRGRLLVERVVVTPLTDLPGPELPELPQPAPRARDAAGPDFEVRLVDEIGRGVSGVDADFSIGGSVDTLSTNAAGLAMLDSARAWSAAVSFPDAAALAKALDPRWERRRPGQAPRESNLQQVVFRGGPLGPFDLKPAVPNTIVVQPPLGKLFVELLDKTGRVRHAARDFSIKGPDAFSGTTDADGRLLVENVFPGDYELELTLKFFQGDPDEVTETVGCPLVVLEPEAGEPQVRLLGAAPRSVLARLKLFFNTNKAFLLPTALPSILKLRSLYADNAPCKLLVVGHADTKGDAAFNSALSLKRAQATIAFLKDDVDAWLKLYDDDDPKQRWGKVEDHLMLTALPDFADKPKGANEIEWFQRTRELDVDGKAGPETRAALITEYMALDGASLVEFVGEIDAVAHGCGESFPLDERGEELDEDAPDEQRDPGDRRVELFFFDPEFGITPQPPGDISEAGSTEYPKWRERASEIVELLPGDPDAPTVHTVALASAHFRTDSAAVLPEGETPDASEHTSLTAAGAFAAALVFAEENPTDRLVVAGHTDTEGSEQHNQPLSEERAACALACLTGDRDSFAGVCDGRHQIADVKQILSWAKSRFGFACDPGKIDDRGDTLSQPLWGFQASYNENRAALGIPDADAITVDGKLGPETWGAIFDCYEAALGAEVSESEEPSEKLTELAELRRNLAFLRDDKKSVGFGETHPIDELGRDNVDSQTNRRVELMFFEEGVEPDLDAAPEDSEIFVPGNFNEVLLPAAGEGQVADRSDTLEVTIQDETGAPITGAAFEVTLPGGRSVKGTLDDSGVAKVLAAPPGESTFVCSIDESVLPVPPSEDAADDDASADEVADDAATGASAEVLTASDLASGVSVARGTVTLRVGLGEVLIATDFDPDESEDMQLTLRADDGSFSASRSTTTDGIVTNGGIDVLFSGLATLGKTYTLTAGVSSEEPDEVFSGLTFTQLQGITEELAADQIEPGRGASDDRIAELDTDDLGDGSDSTAGDPVVVV